MSAAGQQQRQPVADPYLASDSCRFPRVPGEQANNLVLDPKYNSVDLWTPIGRLAFVNVETPRAIEASKPNDRSYSATIIMNPVAIGDLWTAIVMVANAGWPPEQMAGLDPANPAATYTITGEHRLTMPKNRGGIHMPLRHGEDIYAAAMMKGKTPKDYAAFLGCDAINAGLREFRYDKAGNVVAKNDPPLVLDEGANVMAAGKLYSGAYGRLKLRVYAFKGATNSGVTVLLQVVQFARHGEKMGGFNVLANAQATGGALPKSDVPEPGFGPNIGGGAGFAAPAGPPGAMVPGFAAPPAPQQQAAAGQPAAQPSVQPGFAAPQQQPPAAQPGFASPPGTVPWGQQR